MNTKASVPEGRPTRVSATGILKAGANAVISLLVAILQLIGYVLVLRSADRRRALQMAISAHHSELSRYSILLSTDRPSARTTAGLGDFRQTILARTEVVLGEIEQYKKEREELESGGWAGRWARWLELWRG